jgi:site-specific recombinase XerD
MGSTPAVAHEDAWRIVTDLVLDGISSHHTRRAYSQALEEFLVWFRDEPNRQFNKATVQKYLAELETKGLAPSSINVRPAAIRSLSLEASDDGRLDAELAAGIARAKGAKRSAVLLGHWLTAEQTKQPLAAPDLTSFKGKHDRAAFSLLPGGGLRRSEVAALDVAQMQKWDGWWFPGWSCSVDNT